MPPRRRRASAGPCRSGVLLAGLAAIVVAGLVGGGRALEGIRTTDRVEVIAHRGAAAARPENTMAAIERGIEDGADWIEIDVQETADGEVVVFHDSDFMRLAHVDRKIWEVTAAELRDIDLGSWFDPAYAGERAPTLRDVLAAARGRAKVVIELKYYGHDQDLEARVAALVDEFGMADQVALMSLSYPAIQKARAMRPDLRNGVLAATAVGDLAGLETDFLAVNVGLATPKLIRSAHAAGKDVYVWTVNDPLTMSRLISQGVDGLITDEPAVAREGARRPGQARHAGAAPPVAGGSLRPEARTGGGSRWLRLASPRPRSWRHWPPSAIAQDAAAPEDPTSLWRRMELPAHRALQRVRETPGTTLAPFTTDGCSGGLSDVWRVVADRFPAFAEAHRQAPPWEGCCVIHDRAYHAAGPDAEAELSYCRPPERRRGLAALRDSLGGQPHRRAGRALRPHRGRGSLRLRRRRRGDVPRCPASAEALALACRGAGDTAIRTVPEHRRAR